MLSSHLRSHADLSATPEGRTARTDSEARVVSEKYARLTIGSRRGRIAQVSAPHHSVGAYLVKAWRELLIRVLWIVLAGLLAAGAAQATNNPVPFVEMVSPVSVVSGSTGLTLTVYGDGFIANSSVTWNSTSLTTTLVNSHTLTATVPDALIFGAGTAVITVVNGTPGGGSSNVFYLPVGQTQAAASFPSSGTSVSTGNDPIAVATGDFNGDGIPDLAVGNASSDTVSILFGNGDGTFTAASSPLSVGNFPTAIVAQDFGNGHTDLAVLNGSYDEVYLSIFLNDGTGSFTALPTVSIPVTYSYGMVAADFNGDGNLDLAVTDLENSRVQILLGNGDGTFTTGSTPATGSSPFGIVAGDFNEDGNLDLAVATESSSVTILLGNGDGTFTAGTPITAATGSRSLVLADLNNDGHADLAVLGYDSVFGYLGDGTGAFTLASTTSVQGSGPQEALSIAAGDFNNDGKTDILAYSIFEFGDSEVNLLPGNGNGTFGSVTTLTTSSSEENFQMAVADFNGDGNLDFATTGSYTSVSVWIQAPPVELTPATAAFAGQNVGTSSSALNVTLTNNTGSTLTFTGLAISGADSSDFSQTNTCGSSIAAPGTCTISITFTPQAAGAREAVLQISDSGGSGTQSLALTGTGIQTTPTAGVSPGSLTFTSQAVGTTSTAQTSTLSVTGSIALNISGIAVTGANAADFMESDNCGSSVAGNASCTISVQFAPSAVGSRTATVTITDNASDSPQSIALSGTAAQGTPTITWATPAAIAQGTALSGTQLDATSNVPGTFAYNPPSGTVLSAGSQTLSVTFTPNDTTDYTTASAQVTLQVNQAQATNFALSSASSSGVISSGGSATFTVTVTPTPAGSSLSGTVTFSASGVPTGYFARFSPSTLTPGSSAASTTLTIQAGTPSAAPFSPNSKWPFMPLGILTLAIGLLAASRLLPRFVGAHIQPRYAMVSICILALVGMVFSVAGCGGTTPPQTYPITVTATNGAMEQSMTVELTILQP